MRAGRGFRLLTVLAVLCAITPACEPPVRQTPAVVTAGQTRLAEQTRVIPVTATPALSRSFAVPHPLLGDVRVRQGIAYCTNRAELVAAVYPWLQETRPLEMDSFLPRAHWAYLAGESALARYPFDPHKGEALFQAAGWQLAPGAAYRTNVAGEEMALTLTTTEARFRQTWAGVFEEQMKNCGLRIVRLHTPAQWFFGEATGLARRDFELAAYAWMSAADPGGREAYRCDQIPSPENGWRGSNYSGWCNLRADQAIRAATSTLEREKRREAYRIVQQEFSRDAPGLPLFNRVDVSAAAPALENFAPDAVQVHTWNVAQWVLPGKDTLILAASSEPVSLFEDAYVSQIIRAMVLGLDYTSLNYDFQPVTLEQFPTVENGGAVNNTVQVQAGASVVDVEGKVVELEPGVVVWDAEGDEIEYTGGAAQMRQLVVEYEFVAGLIWSDGTPVSKADYELAYRIFCDPEAWKSEYGSPPPACGKIANVEFVNDTGYTVTWKPGYQDPSYFLPPLGRLPSHQVLSDGRKMAAVPAREWLSLAEVRRAPLGIGPYVIREWVYGEKMLLIANPYYYAGPPATPNIIIRFLPANQIVDALVKGQVDAAGWDSLYQDPKAMDVLTQAQAQGKIRLYLVPSAMYERIDFALFVP